MQVPHCSLHMLARQRHSTERLDELGPSLLWVLHMLLARQRHLTKRLHGLSPVLEEPIMHRQHSHLTLE